MARLESIRVLPVVVIDDAADAVPLAEALLRGGVPFAEITLRTPAALDALEAMASCSAGASAPSSAGEGFLVGAGTVVTASQVDATVERGARFIVSPGFSLEVVRRASAVGVAVVPGVATATEVMTAVDEGCGVVKLFPAAQLGGAAAISALRGPFPEIGFVPSGGIGIEQAPSYAAGAVDGVISVSTSWIAPRADIRAGRFDEIAERARVFRQAVLR